MLREWVEELRVNSALYSGHLGSVARVYMHAAKCTIHYTPYLHYTLTPYTYTIHVHYTLTLYTYFYKQGPLSKHL